ncbi:LIPASE [Salix koriyanagi]|uniref:LIPASE n=2 Tax=Salix koriyanagi TaxID=2511006 RepID=A0A9Q0X6Y7_9ROSI|nr:LIPASE [Salix koriyanagi]
MICSCRSLQASALSFLLFFTSRRGRGRDMSCPNSLLSNPRKIATLRLSKVSGHTTELLEIQSDKPTCHVLFIPGNPGVVSFYKDFLESLYELLGASASVTAIGHISHTEKNWEHGKLFSLQDQIDHKVDFIKQELQNIELPIILVGHSIGSYISLEMLRSLEKVTYLIGLYPFLMLNPLSKQQSNIENVAESSILSALLSFSVATLGLLPQCTLRFMLSKSLGSSWSDTAIDAACSHLLQYHTFRNMLYMALMEFRKLSEMPDWAFMRENHEKIAFLFGVDDHWGPLQMFEEISKQAPGISLSIEREGHTHSFCCTEAGSEWVAHHVASLIKKKISS